MRQPDFVAARPLRSGASAHGLAVLVLVAAAFALADSAWGRSAEVSFTVNVPAGESKAGIVRSIPKKTKLAVEVRSDGNIEILLLSPADYRRFPAVERPIFRGQTSDWLSGEVLAPESGDYYVVIDNRSGATARSVEVTVRGEAPDGAKIEGRVQARDPSVLEAESRLRGFEEKMGLLFAFEPFPIHVRVCEKAEAYVDSSGSVVLCQELLGKLREHMEDRDKMEDALVFTLFHEIGHVLLRQWGYPTHDSEETADEFATVMLLMLGHGERLRAQADFFLANASIFEVITKALRDDRHPLFAQRARNLASWARDSGLVQRWQPALVPHMQTALLERLTQRPTPWADLALVERELAARR